MSTTRPSHRTSTRDLKTAEGSESCAMFVREENCAGLKENVLEVTRLLKTSRVPTREHGRVACVGVARKRRSALA